MEAILEEKRNGLTIKIIPDTDGGFSPDESGDDSIFLVGYHRDFTVEGPKKAGRLVFTKAEVIEIAEDPKHEARRKYHVFGLEAYIHSGVRLALSQEGNFPDRRWDVSQLGMIFAEKKHWPRIKAARIAARSLIREWNDYLSGNVYGYQVLDAAGEILESCWGYTGDYDQPGGPLDEARAIVDRLTNEGRTDASGQYLFAFAQ